MRRARTPLALAALLLAVPAASHAEVVAPAWSWDQASSCLSALQGSESADWDAGPRCVGDRLGGVLLDGAARYLTEQGRGVFGEHFSLVHRMTWSPLGRGLAGELDAVLPLASRGGAKSWTDDGGFTGSAFFLQQGMTRWTDDRKFRRNDLRLGGAFRFARGRSTGADGVDFVDEPVLVTIPRGATTGRATFHLPENPSLSAERTLSVAVTRTV